VTTHFFPAARLVFFDLSGSVLWFPIWWYTTGLKKVVLVAWRTLVFRVQSYGLKVWIRNFFVPMYGQHDITGRLISVAMRLVVLIGRIVELTVEALVYLAGITAWIVAPPVLLGLAITSGIRGAFFEQARTMIR
jgi:hypothetical protein